MISRLTRIVLGSILFLIAVDIGGEDDYEEDEEPRELENFAMRRLSDGRPYFEGSNWWLACGDNMRFCDGPVPGSLDFCCCEIGYQKMNDSSCVIATTTTTTSTTTADYAVGSHDLLFCNNLAIDIQSQKAKPGRRLSGADGCDSDSGSGGTSGRNSSFSGASGCDSTSARSSSSVSSGASGCDSTSARSSSSVSSGASGCDSTSARASGASGCVAAKRSSGTQGCRTNGSGAKGCHHSGSRGCSRGATLKGCDSGARGCHSGACGCQLQSGLGDGFVLILMFVLVALAIVLMQVMPVMAVTTVFWPIFVMQSIVFATAQHIGSFFLLCVSGLIFMTWVSWACWSACTHSIRHHGLLDAEDSQEEELEAACSWKLSE